MITSRLFTENNVTDFFHNRRGFATVWLIAAICFVVVFLGIVFLLLRDKTPDLEPKPVAATFKPEVREPIKSSAPLNKTLKRLKSHSNNPAIRKRSGRKQRTHKRRHL